MARKKLKELKMRMAFWWSVYDGNRWSESAPYGKRRMLYIMQCGEFVKIGISKMVQDRLRTIRTSNPQEVTLLRVYTSDIQDAESMEFLLHRSLKEFHVRGEWFKSEALEHVKMDCKPAPEPDWTSLMEDVSPANTGGM